MFSIFESTIFSQSLHRPLTPIHLSSVLNFTAILAFVPLFSFHRQFSCRQVTKRRRRLTILKCTSKCCWLIQVESQFDQFVIIFLVIFYLVTIRGGYFFLVCYTPLFVFAHHFLTVVAENTP